MDEVTIAHIAAAETLLRELKPQAKDPMRFRVLQVRARGKERERKRINVGGTEWKKEEK